MAGHFPIYTPRGRPRVDRRITKGKAVLVVRAGRQSLRTQRIVLMQNEEPCRSKR